MKLSPPQVVGPISTCNTEVRVQGQLTGATVLIIRNGDTAKPIAKNVASWPDQVFPLNQLPPGGLQPNDKLTAIQSVGSDSSDQSPQAPNYYVVQDFTPAILKETIFSNHLYVCGRHLRLLGMAPGATAEAGPNGARGKATAPCGEARLTINSGLKKGEQIDVRQVGCGPIGPTVLGPEPDATPITAAKRLPTPQIAAPAYACDRSVYISGMVVGAEISLLRNGLPPATTGVYFESAWFDFGSPPLKEAETLTVRQAMPGCDLQASDVSSPPAGVLPAKQAPAPFVAKPLCEKVAFVAVSGLTPGAKVRILLNHAELVVGESPSSWFAFAVPPLVAGSMITAQQERCNVWSPESSPVTVDASPENIPAPKIAVDPLYECATVVPVTGIHPGSVLIVTATFRGAISAATFVNTTDAAIPVAPALIAGDEVMVWQYGCGGSEPHSDKVKVASAPKLGSPTIATPVESGQSSVIVQGIVPGAMVEVYRNLDFVKAVNVGLAQVTINLGVMLQIGDRLNTRQILCNQASALDLAKSVSVVQPNPSAPISLQPNGGKFGQQPQFSWADPGQGKPNAATSFLIQVFANGKQLSSGTPSAPNYSVGSPLPYSANITWRVRGHNSTGDGPWAQGAFQIVDPPPPPKAKGPSQIQVFNCNTEYRTVFIWLYDKTAQTLNQAGTIDSQYDNSGSCPAAGSAPLVINLTDGHTYQIVAVDPGLIGCGVNDATAPSCWRWGPVTFVADKNGPVFGYTIS
jgi:hypothetical protein